MRVLQRAKRPLEQRILKNAQKYSADVTKLKAYLLLKPNGSFLMNTNGQVAMILLTDDELEEKLNTGKFALKSE